LDQDVFVYRDVSEPAPTSSRGRPARDDPAYWYDLMAEDAAPQAEAARGPFEPLLPSSTPAGAVGQQPAEDPVQGSPDAAGDDRTEPPEQARARKLEQLKDLYLTAEAIGEQNVDKHFDQLLAQQRELISDYFKQSAVARPSVAEPGAADPGTGEADTTHPYPDPAGGQSGPPQGAGVRAEPPGAW
jgi:hypothetical protein